MSLTPEEIRELWGATGIDREIPKYTEDIVEQLHMHISCLRYGDKESPFTFVEDDGDDGEEYSGHYQMVFIYKGDYYGLDYSYKSHYGNEYYGSNIYRVTPQEITKTIYQ